MKRVSFSLQLLLGLVVGAALGFAARVWNLEWLANILTEVGNIFVQLLGWRWRRWCSPPWW